MLRNAKSSSKLPMVRRFALCLIWLTFFVNLATFELRIKNKAGKEGVYTVGAFASFGV